LEREFHGKTVTEVFEILGKRKRDAADVGNEDVMFGKRIDQQEH